MKRLLLLTLMGALLLSAALVLAGDGFYVIVSSSKTGTPINSVPCTIEASGMYYLNGNLTSNSTAQSGITINASDVTLDLMGFCLTGPGKTGNSADGIHIQNSANNVEIRNGSIKNFGNQGIDGRSGKGNRVIGVRVREVGGSGIWLSGTSHVIANSSAINAVGQGIGAYISDISGLIKGNHVIGNGIGICAGPGSTVADNLVLNNGGNGIYISSGYCTITGNTVRGNVSTGIAAGDYSTVTNNTTQGLSYGAYSTVANNTVY